MRATQKFVTNCFRRYNTQCFGGELPAIPIHMSSAKSFMGQLRFSRERTLLGGVRYFDFSLRVNARFDVPQEVIEDTVIHEMIHYYIHFKGLVDDAPHGTIFRRIMNEINTKHGRNVSVRHNATLSELDSDRRIRAHFICISILKGGKRYITVCARKSVLQIYNVLKESPKVISTEWYYSQDPYFNRYPNSTTAKLYVISDDDYDRYISQAMPLRYDGTSLRRRI